MAKAADMVRAAMTTTAKTRAATVVVVMRATAAATRVAMVAAVREGTAAIVVEMNMADRSRTSTVDESMVDLVAMDAMTMNMAANDIDRMPFILDVLLH